MSDIIISPLVETWRIANLTNFDLGLPDVPGLTIDTHPLPKMKNGVPQWFDALEFTTSEILAASFNFASGLNSNSIGSEGFKHTHEGSYDIIAEGGSLPDATDWHSHSGLDILTGGTDSNADALHTHDGFATDEEVNALISTAIGDIDLDAYVTKAGSITQLSDITSEGSIIEAAIVLAHAQDHTILEHLDDIEPFTMANYRKLVDGSNADCCHIHSGGGGTFDGEHNDLDGLQGGIVGQYYHLTAIDITNITTLTDGSNADALHIHAGGGGTSIHNELTGLQGGDPDEDEFYHLDYVQYIGLTGGPSFYADDLHNHDFASTAFELPLGPTCDAGWEGGLFPWTVEYQTSCALDDINEVLGSLAPSPAPDLDNVDVDTGGTTGDLSFGPGQTIGGYSNVDGIGSVSPTDTAVTYDESFANSGTRVGVTNNSTDITGTLNEDVAADPGSPNPSYPANAFGNADLGELILEVNDVEVRTVDLTTQGTLDDPSNVSGFYNLIAATSNLFPNGDPFTQFKYRTGNYRVDSGDVNLTNGWNYARVIHRIGGSDTVTNYVDWVIDADTTSTTYSNESLHTLSMTGSKHLSGVEYHTGGTALFNYDIDNAQRNTYIENNAITFNDSNLVNISPEDLLNNGGDEGQQHSVTGKTVTINANRLLDGSISARVSTNRTVQADTNGNTQTISGILMDNDTSSATEAGVEDFVAETYRMRSNSDFTSTTFASNWDETEFIYDAGNTGYLGGLQVTNDILDYPTLDYRNVTITEGPAGNPDYSGGTCTGTRYYYRYFKNTSLTTGNFTMNFNGSGSFVPEDEIVFSGNDIKVSMRLPTQTAWMDCYKDFVTNQWNDGNGCRASGGRGFDDWLLTVGTKNTANSGNGIYIRITVPVNWTGNISHLTMAFS